VRTREAYGPGAPGELFGRDEGLLFAGYDTITSTPGLLDGQASGSHYDIVWRSQAAADAGILNRSTAMYVKVCDYNGVPPPR